MEILQEPLQYLDNNFERFVQELSEHARIPSISFPGFPEGPMGQSAQWTAARMGQAGLENVAILEIPGAHPYVYGDWLHAPGAPTLLLYAHHDVQPPGRIEKWLSPPFEPTIRGGRIFGRGTADDKAGGMVHLAAIEAYLKTVGTIPVNVRFIIEGEEETGSEHLLEFLKSYSEKLKCDVMVLTDTANLQEGLPSLTYRLRGIVDAVLEVKVLDHPLHSGFWGGPAIDALSVLNQILARLWTADGKIAIPGSYDDIIPPSGEEGKRLRALPFEEKKFREEMGAVPGFSFAGEKEFSIYERMWCRPLISILGIDAPWVQETSNQLVESARAKISMRIVHGMDPKKTLKKLCDFLAANPPHGADVKVIPGTAGDSWYTETKRPAFAAAERALKKGFSCEPVYIGCGGSIPFVKPLTKHFGDIPALLMGIEDPRTNAHGENESLSLSDFQKGMAAAVHLYDECAQAIDTVTY
jgi:acetylornithine deacetylase/succinyl-diaminopimelate desuccinylase-like protein